VLTSRGVVFVDTNHGEAPALRCNEAFFVNTSAVPQLWGRAGYLALKTQYDVLHSQDRGCTLVRATGLPDVSLGGYAVVPDLEETMLVATSQPDPHGGVYASHDHGVSFERRYAGEHDEAFTELRVAPSMAARIYASGFRLDALAMKVSFVWAVSNDVGRTFTRTPLTTERVLLGVSAQNPELVFAYEKLPTDTQEVAILQSDDGGATFTDRLHLTGRPVFAASADVVWLGATETKGLFTSRDGGRTFSVAATDLTSISCLAHHDGVLHVCARRFPIELGVWSLASEQAPLEPVLAFAQVATPVQCADDQGVCTASWQDWSAELLSALPVADAGTPADADAGSGTATALPQPTADASVGSADAAVRGPNKPENAGCAAARHGSGDAPRLASCASLLSGLFGLTLAARRRRKAESQGLRSLRR
jgi:hypothetical protein